MIQWLVQSVADHPDLGRGMAPVDMLSAREKIECESLKFGKRRRDWILGRWTAKHLLQAHLYQKTGMLYPLYKIEIGNDKKGVPFATLLSRMHLVHAGGDWQSGQMEGGRPPAVCRLPMSISLSHSDDHAFCAIVASGSDQYQASLLLDTDPAGQEFVGADIEQVERRSWLFVEDYFTTEEIEQVKNTPEPLQDTIITAIWSAKEAVLKALRLGLTVDTRAVSCVMSWEPSSREGPRSLRIFDSFRTSMVYPGYENSSWADFHARCEPKLFHNGHGGDAHHQQISGWWTTLDGFTLTIALYMGK
ncbi:MAG: 4'-phosphopantetheinyl transferase superfamily protein [Chloroflexi bacterium]|nr:4'-phosphopantetheinyl transferase superfamily protein [Chloroflexota bacterium]